MFQIKISRKGKNEGKWMITGVDQLDQMMHGRERRKVEEVERRQGDVTEGRQQE